VCCAFIPEEMCQRLQQHCGHRESLGWFMVGCKCSQCMWASMWIRLHMAHRNSLGTDTYSKPAAVFMSCDGMLLLKMDVTPITVG